MTEDVGADVGYVWCLTASTPRLGVHAVRYHEGSAGWTSQRPRRSTTYQQLVLEEWTATETVAAWHRWLPKQIGQFGPATELLAQAAGVSAGDAVLDLGSGVGDPALTLAELVGPTGSVTATDLVDAMVRACQENARARGMTNVECRQADAQALPFDDADV